MRTFKIIAALLVAAAVALTPGIGETHSADVETMREHIL